MAAQERIAVLGIGGMGTPIARDLLAAGFPVTVWNRTKSKADALAGDGAKVASTPAEAVAESDLVLTMLTDGAAAAETMGADDGAEVLRDGAVWIQMGTVGLSWTERLAALAGERKTAFVDAPVSGSTGPAEAGELVVLASGPENVRSRVQPVFDTIGSQTVWLGQAGNGTRMKLAFNNWLAASTEALAETLALTDALGLDPKAFVDVFADSPLSSPYAVLKGRAMVAGDFAPGFPLRLAYKDTALALDAAREPGVDLPLTEALEGRWRDAISRGHGDEDLAAIITEANRRNGA